MLVAADKAPAPMKEGDVVSYKGRKAYKVRTIWGGKNAGMVDLFYTGGDPAYGGFTISAARLAWSTDRNCWVVMKAKAA